MFTVGSTATPQTPFIGSQQPTPTQTPSPYPDSPYFQNMLNGKTPAQTPGSRDPRNPATPAASQDATEFYGNYFAPGAQAAQDMLLGNARNPFNPIMWPTLAPTDRRMQQGIDATSSIANRGKANDFGAMGLNTITGMADRNGLAPGTGAPLDALRDVTTGRDKIGGASEYGRLVDNPLAPGQLDAGRYYDKAQGGQYDVGTGYYDGLLRRGGTNNEMNRAGSTYDRYRTGAGDVATGGFDPYAAQQMNAAQGAASGTYDQFMDGSRNVSTGRMSDVYGRAQGPTYSEQNLADMASMTPGTNPYLDDLESLLNDQIRAESRRAASSAGRGYGSGFESEMVADSIAKNMLQGRLSQYNADADRQLSANNLMDTQRMAALGMQRGLAGDIAGVQAGNQGRALSASDSIANLGNFLASQGLDATSAIANLQGQNADRRLGAAQMQQGLGQQALTNEMTAANNKKAIQQANRDFRMQGANASASLGQQGVENRLSGLQGLTQVQGANIANQANTAQAEIAARQGGLGTMLQGLNLGPDLSASRYTDANQMIGVGDYQQSRKDALQAEKVANTEEKRMADLRALESYMALINGSAPTSQLSYLSNAQAINAQKPNPTAQTLGLVGTGLGIANQTGLLGGGLNFLGGLF